MSLNLHPAYISFELKSEREHAHFAEMCDNERMCIKMCIPPIQAAF